MDSENVEHNHAGTRSVPGTGGTDYFVTPPGEAGTDHTGAAYTEGIDYVPIITAYEDSLTFLEGEAASRAHELPTESARSNIALESAEEAQISAQTSKWNAVDTEYAELIPLDKWMLHGIPSASMEECLSENEIKRMQLVRRLRLAGNMELATRYENAEAEPRSACLNALLEIEEMLNMQVHESGGDMLASTMGPTWVDSYFKYTGSDDSRSPKYSLRARLKLACTAPQSCTDRCTQSCHSDSRRLRNL